jgi:hypothetical protein
MKFFYLFLAFLQWIQCQRPMNIFKAVHYNFGASGEYLFVPQTEYFEVWNTTDSRLLRNFTKKKSDRIKCFGNYYYIYSENEVPGTIRKFNIVDDSLVAEYSGEDKINNVQVNSKYVYYVSLYHRENICTLKILSHEMKMIYNTYFNDYSGSKLIINSCAGDENGIYVGYAKEAVEFQEISLVKYPTNSSRSHIWEIRLPGCFSSQNVGAIGLTPFVFVNCENILYQIDEKSGIIIRKIPTSGLSIKKVTTSENFLFIYLVNGQILQLNLWSSDVIEIYNHQIMLNSLGTIIVSNNFLFYSETNITSPEKGLEECTGGYSNQILQFSPRQSSKKTEYFESGTIDLTLPSDQLFNISHLNSPPDYGVNTVFFKNIFNWFGRTIEHNAYITPIYFSSWERPGNSIFAYFSGAGNIEKACCGDDFLHIFSINSTTDDIKVNSIDKKIFKFDLISACRSTQEAKSIDLFSSIYDYAAILLNPEGNPTYLIHGGCLCYTNRARSTVIGISIPDSLVISYEKYNQNIDLTTYTFITNTAMDTPLFREINLSIPI